MFHPQETPNIKVGPLTLDTKLFVGTHVPKIVVIKHHGQTGGANSSPISKFKRKDVLLELVEVSKSLQEIITTSTIGKRNMDRSIKMLTKEKKVEVEDEEKPNNE